MRARRIAQITPLCLLGAAAASLACHGDRGSVGALGTDGQGFDAGSASGPSGGTGASGGSESQGPRLDVAESLTSGGESCRVDADDGLNAPGACGTRRPPDSFNPAVQWSFGETLSTLTTPLVANLTDDNGDGRVDLCDVPDVVLVGYAEPDGPSRFNYRRLYVLDGATGALHWSSDIEVTAGTPALGDVDDDGVAEIVTATCEGEMEGSCLGTMIAFEGDGTIAWTGHPAPATTNGCHVALADADNDGDVEIACATVLYDHEGKRLADARGRMSMAHVAPTWADLDGDGDQELVYGDHASHHDGTLYYEASIRDGFPQIADLDGDGAPEVLVTNSDGVNIVEHDGRIKVQGLTPTGIGTDYIFGWMRPAAIHDFDGDGDVEFALAASSAQEERGQYAVIEPDGTVQWAADITDFSGIAGGTAFDFLGDGSAEAMYSDEHNLLVFDETGRELMRGDRVSQTLIEYAVVADVDNDGASEILVPSDLTAAEFFGPGTPTWPALQVLRDEEDRWVQSRRIWNQHTYHVTNVAEDGRIPQHEPPSWEALNTFRTNAQIEGGSVCRPPPAG